MSTTAATPSRRLTIRRSHVSVAGIATAVTALVTTFLGNDVSHYQSPKQVTQERSQFVIAKASQGTTYRDPEYATYLANARAAGTPFGAYHFLTHGSVAAQATSAYAATGRAIPLAVDCEWAGKCTAADLTGFVRAYRSLGGRITLLYVPRTYWAEIGSPKLSGIGGVQLWNARYLYTGKYPGHTGTAWQGYGGLTVVMLQYSDGGGVIDHDAFYGTRAQLCGYLHCWDTTSPVATKPPAKTPTTTPTKHLVQPVTKHPARTRATYVTVRRGDNLTKIARRAHTTWRRLASLNHLRAPYRISPRQRLRVS